MEPTQARNGAGSEFDLIGDALAAAQRAHARGEWGAVRSWAALAVATIERGAPPAVSGRNTGNAAQLLDVLHLYDRFARGRDPERDVRIDSLTASLYELESLNRHAAWWTHGAASGIDHDPITRLVRRLDGRTVDYDTWTRQIVRFGAIQVQYDPWSRMPRRIGPVEITYDPFRDYPRAIAGVDIR